MTFFSLNVSPKLLKPFSFHGRFSANTMLSVIPSHSRQLTVLFVVFSLLLALLYVLEFNLILGFGDRISFLEKDVKRYESEIDSIEAQHSRKYTETLSSSFDGQHALQKVGTIEYIEHKQKSLAEAPFYMP